MQASPTKFCIVRTGTWRYAGEVERPVDIVALDFDWWYSLAEADGQLEQGEKPIPLGPHGLLYYARFQRAGELALPTWVDTPGFGSLEEAISEAEKKVIGGIRWQP